MAEMSQRGIRTKLLGITLGLLAILTAGSLLTVRHYFGQQLRQEAVRELRIGSRVLTSIVERSGQQLMERGKLLVELPSLQKALLKEKNQLEPLLLEVKAVRAANLLWATDPSGAVLASTGEYPPVGENFWTHPLVTAARNGQPAMGFDLFGDAWWLLLCLPVREASSGRVIGTVGLALLVGEAYLARLSELLKTRVGFIWGEHQSWSEGWPEPIRAQIASHLAQGLTGKPQEAFHLQEGKVIWLGRAVTGGDPPIAAGPIAVLGIRLDESVIQHSTRRIIWIALFTMAIGAFLSTAALKPVLSQLEQAQTQLLRAEKMASIGQLAAGVAHELNNPLMVIMGNAQLAKRSLTREKNIPDHLSKELLEMLSSLDQEAHRSKEIVRNLLDFARIRPPTRTKVDLNALLEDSLRLVGHQVGLQTIQIVREFRENLPQVSADPDQIKQVLVNILLNAVQAMPQGGTLTLRSDRSDRDVTLTLQDTGVGISEEQMGKVFDPFFTTKEVGQGTGLGLFVSYGIIQRHQGTIQLSSQVGKGTTVSIRLPL